MNEKNLRKLKRTVYTLLVLSIITFLSGFLQYTKFKFIIYVLYFFLSVGGIILIVRTLKSKVTRMLKASLLLTGFSSTLFILFTFIAFLMSIQSGIDFTEIIELLEPKFYLNSIIFLIGVIGSLVMLRRKRK